MHYRARYYDPLLGRFLAEDDLGNDDGDNVYDYVGNNPLIFSDPTGYYKVKGFSPEHEQQIRDAIQAAINKLKKEGCNGCAGPNGPKIINVLQHATFVSGGKLLGKCATAQPLKSKKITIGDDAFGKGCCSLESTLAHEALHKVQYKENSQADEDSARQFEHNCFGCAYTPIQLPPSITIPPFTVPRP